MKRDIESVYNNIINSRQNIGSDSGADKTHGVKNATKFYLSTDPDDTKILELSDGITINLTRIVASRDILNKKTKKVSIAKGTKGGYVESEENLSQQGRCWIFHDAMVFGDAFVSDNAVVKNKVIVCGKAQVRGKAIVSQSAIVSDNALVADNSKITGSSQIGDDAKVVGFSKVMGSAKIFGQAKVVGGTIRDEAVVCGEAVVRGTVRGQSEVGDHATIGKNSIIESSIICQNATVNNSIVNYSAIYGNASVESATIKESSQVCDDAILDGTQMKYDGGLPSTKSIYIKFSKILGKTIITNKLANATDYSNQTHIFDSTICDAQIEESTQIEFSNLSGVSVPPNESICGATISSDENKTLYSNQDAESTTTPLPDDEMPLTQETTGINLNQITPPNLNDEDNNLSQ